MSRGPGRVISAIMDTLQGSKDAVSSDELRQSVALEVWPYEKSKDFDAWEKVHHRSIRMSVGRALRQLEAAGKIKRNKTGEWYPAKDWLARDLLKRERTETAYHEAGHAVIGLALKLPIAFVTIKPKSTYLGIVHSMPQHHGVGKVWARGKYDKPIAEIKKDPFGNEPEDKRDDAYYHSDIVMSIAGGMAGAKFTNDQRAWRNLESTSGDKRCITYDRKKLGDKARTQQQYETECRELVERYWPMIEAVADMLLKEETLSGNDVYRICDRTAQNVVRRQHLPKRGKR